MKNNYFFSATKFVIIVTTLLLTNNLQAQLQQGVSPTTKSDFWNHVQFGGGLGLGFGSGYTDISISPSAVYNFNPKVALGTSLLFGYVSSKNEYNSTMIGGSLIGLVNPIPQIQFSAELEEINVNTSYKYIGGNLSNNFWNTALYLGAGYRTGNVTIGARFDVLHNDDKSIYGDAFMPFVRVYF